MGRGFAAIASSTPVSLAFVAGETGIATLGVVVIMAVVLLMRARVWQTPEVTSPGDQLRHLERSVAQ